MFKKAKENKKGFTLAELLIVVAIIALIVCIFSQLNEPIYCMKYAPKPIRKHSMNSKTRLLTKNPAQSSLFASMTDAGCFC